MMTYLRRYVLYLSDRRTKCDFADALVHVKLFGINNDENGAKFKKFIGILCILPFTIMFFSSLVIHPQFSTLNNRLDVSIEYCQVIIKFLLLICNKKNLRKLIRDTEEFYPLSAAPSPKNYAAAQRPHLLMKLIFNFYRLFLSIAAMWYLLGTLFKEGELGVALYGMEDGKIPLINLQLFFVFIYVVFVINLYYGFDGLFIYLIGHVIGELRIVNMKFKELTENATELKGEDRRLFRAILQHHSKILKFIFRIRKVYSITLLSQYLSSMSNICGGLFLTIKGGFPPSPMICIQCAIYILFYLWQIWLYCYLGNILTSEATKIENLFHNVWKCGLDYSHKKEVLIILHKAQQDVGLTIGGFMNLDLNSFTQIIRTAASFAAFVDTVYNK